MELENKVALVTGAGGKGGIGCAIALRLAKAGADIIVNDLFDSSKNDSEAEGLSSVAHDIQKLGRQTLAVAADISDAVQVENMISESLRQFGHIDILVNNAGAPAGPDRVPLIELKEESWDLVQQVNVKGTFLCTQAVARCMIENNIKGKIVNISSIAGKIGFANTAAYCTSKAAILGFTRALACEFGPYGITVNAICPGFISGTRLQNIAEAEAPAGINKKVFAEKRLQAIEADNPLGRLGQAADVANMAAFLVSSQADWITGISVTISGGTVMD